jgi:hypothetical protein
VAAQGPLLAGRPSVAGTLQQGQRLTARPGSWLGSGTVAYAFQWYRCDANVAHCHSIHGATKSSYLQVAKDVAHTLALTVRATDANGTTTAYAPAAGLVTAAGALTATRWPALAGKASVGQTLVLAPAKWSSKPGAVTRAWLRCNPNGRACSGITGAAGSSYVLTADDRGHVVIAAVHAAAGTTVLAPASLPVS